MIKLEYFTGMVQNKKKKHKENKFGLNENLLKKLSETHHEPWHWVQVNKMKIKIFYNIKAMAAASSVSIYSISLSSVIPKCSPKLRKKK